MDKFEFTKHVCAAELDVYEKAVLYTVAEHYNWKKQNPCWISQGNLALEAGMSRQKAHGVLLGLLGKGWLLSHGKNSLGTDYLEPVVPEYKSVELKRRSRPSEPVAENDKVVAENDKPVADDDRPVAGGDTNNEYNNEVKEEVNNEEEELGLDESSFADVEDDAPPAAGCNGKSSFVNNNGTSSLFNEDEVRAEVERRGLDPAVLRFVLDPKWKDHITDVGMRCAWARSEVEWAEREKALANDDW